MSNTSGSAGSNTSGSAGDVWNRAEIAWMEAYGDELPSPNMRSAKFWKDLKSAWEDVFEMEFPSKNAFGLPVPKGKTPSPVRSVRSPGSPAVYGRVRGNYNMAAREALAAKMLAKVSPKRASYQRAPKRVKKPRGTTPPLVGNIVMKHGPLTFRAANENFSTSPVAMKNKYAQAMRYFRRLGWNLKNVPMVSAVEVLRVMTGRRKSANGRIPANFNRVFGANGRRMYLEAKRAHYPTQMNKNIKAAHVYLQSHGWKNLPWSPDVVEIHKIMTGRRRFFNRNVALARFKRTFGNNGPRIFDAAMFHHYPPENVGLARRYLSEAGIRWNLANNVVKLAKNKGVWYSPKSSPTGGSPGYLAYTPPYVPRSPSARTPSPPKPKAQTPPRRATPPVVELATKIRPILERYGELYWPEGVPLKPMVSREMVNLAKRLRDNKTGPHNLWDSLYRNSGAARKKFISSSPPQWPNMSPRARTPTPSPPKPQPYSRMSPPRPRPGRKPLRVPFLVRPYKEPEVFTPTRSNVKMQRIAANQMQIAQMRRMGVKVPPKRSGIPYVSEEVKTPPKRRELYWNIDPLNNRDARLRDMQLNSYLQNENLRRRVAGKPRAVIKRELKKRGLGNKIGNVLKLAKPTQDERYHSFMKTTRDVSTIKPREILHAVGNTPRTRALIARTVQQGAWRKLHGNKPFTRRFKDTKGGASLLVRNEAWVKAKAALQGVATIREKK